MIDISVCMITYNHERFIKQAIESILEQETVFSFNLIIADDGSKDNTAAICRNLKEKYPDKINFIENQPNIGMMPNFIKALKLCSGKYIALCEGDDYWTDKTKLEQAIRILEEHTEYAICCHGNYKLINHKLIEDNILNINSSGNFTLENYLLQPFFHTSSIVFRTIELIPEIPEWYKDVFAGDNFLVALLASKGYIYYMAKYMSVYRVHQSSISNKYGIINMKENYLKHMKLFNEMKGGKYNLSMTKLKKKWELLTVCYDKNYFRKISYFLKNMPAILKTYKSPKTSLLLSIRYLIPSSLLK
jgi:glycosyltransferase involved in cell wall biosynthesis